MCYLLLLALEVKDGGIARVPHEFTEVATSSGKVERVFGDVVGEMSQTSVLPTFLQGRLTPLL